LVNHSSLNKPALYNQDVNMTSKEELPSLLMNATVSLPSCLLDHFPWMKLLSCHETVKSPIERFIWWEY
jgi:hypothetical protein